MKVTRIGAVLLCTLLLQAFPALGEKYQFLFKGVAYQTNSTGNIVTTPITEQTLLVDRATNLVEAIDPGTVKIVYHVHGDDKGDAVYLADSITGSNRVFVLGFWFGDDASLQRTSLTNSTATEVRQVQYVYTLTPAIYAYPNTHSSGAAFVTRRYLTDTGGTVRTTIEGTMQWVVNAQYQRGTMLCSGTFTLGPLLFPY